VFAVHHLFSSHCDKPWRTSMTRTSSILLLALGMTAATFAAAPAQTPTADQQQAIKSNCAADYRTFCSTVPTGGMDALVCLEDNVAKLSSPACKAAVEAVDSGSDAAAAAPAAAPATEATPPAAADTAASPPADTAAPAATTAAPPPPAETGPVLTLRQEMRLAAGACRTDFRIFCPNLPVGRGNVIFCLRVHGPRLSPVCRNALTTAGVQVQ
jgi:hypothetical protein